MKLRVFRNFKNFVVKIFAQPNASSTHQPVDALATSKKIKLRVFCNFSNFAIKYTQRLT